MQIFVNICSPNLWGHAKWPGAYGRLWLAASGLGLALCFTPATATAKRDTPSPFATTTIAYKVDEAGNRAGRLLPTEQTKPGDILVYRASYRNLTKDLVPKVVMNIQVPPGMVYVADSARPAARRASQDGSNYFLITTDGDVPPVSSWRALQWEPRDLGPLSENVAEIKVRVTKPSGE